MPLYEYICDACGRHFELIRKFSDPPVETCYACGGGPVRKLLSSPAIQFKGTGWYVTDYARKGQAKTDEAPKATQDSKTDTKTDTTSGTTKKDRTP
jgi:putative FmdB family regulatory protein